MILHDPQSRAEKFVDGLQRLGFFDPPGVLAKALGWAYGVVPADEMGGDMVPCFTGPSTAGVMVF